MTETWQTIEQAAVTLGVSVRTINRHITAGKYPSRLVEGRREVFITLPEPAVPPRHDEEPEREPQHAEESNGFGGNGSRVAATATAAPQPTAAATAAPSFDNVAGQSEMMLAISDNWRDQNELVAGAYQTLARNAEAFARSRQRSARVAWSIVGIVTVAVVAAVGWTSYSLTHSTVENDLLKQQLADARREAEKARAEADKYQEHWTAANERTSRALEGRVGGMIDPTAHAAAGPATLAAAPTPATPAPAPAPAPAPPVTQPTTQAAAAPAPVPGPTPGPAPAAAAGSGAVSPTPPNLLAPRPATQPGGFGAVPPTGRG